LAILNDLSPLPSPSRNTRLFILGCVAIGGVQLAEPSAQAELTGPTIEVSGQCPQRHQVISSILGTLPAPYSATETAAKLRVTDHGDRYDVSTGTNTRTYLDPSLQCEERARTVAIFVTLELRPPLIANDEKPAEAAVDLAPVAVARTTSAETIAPPSRWGASIALVGESAGIDVSALGIDVRGIWQPWRLDSAWSLGFGLGLRRGATIEATAPYRARIMRMPADLSLRGQWGQSWLKPFAELGLFNPHAYRGTFSP
jgi:hypothetical protein